MKYQFKLTLTARQLYSLLVLFIFFNILFLTGSAIESIYGGNDGALSFVLKQFSLAHENVIASWYSSMFLLLVAIISFLCFLLDYQNQSNRTDSILKYGWTFISIIFLTLSFDEMGSIHEKFFHLEELKTLNFNDPIYYPVYFLILVGAVYMTTFCWIKFKKSLLSLLFVFIGVLFFLSIPIQETFEGEARNNLSIQGWKRPVTSLLIEEGAEVFGTLCFLIAATLYAVYASKKNQQISNYAICLQITEKFNKVAIWLGVLIISLGISMFLLYLSLDHLPKGDVGVPQNWFPCVLTFIIAICSIYTVTNSKISQKGIARSCIILIGLSLFASMYIGSYMYDSIRLSKGVLFGISIHRMVMIIVLLIGLMLIGHTKNNKERFLVLGWAFILSITLFVKGTLFPYLTFISFSLFLYYMFYQVAGYRASFQRNVNNEYRNVISSHSR